jgi:hypothetical protein
MNTTVLIINMIVMKMFIEIKVTIIIRIFTTSAICIFDRLNRSHILLFAS